MRQRINRAAICSSDNYAVSKRLHREYLAETHKARIENINMFSSSSEKSVGRTIGRPYATVFGHKVYLSLSEAEKANAVGITVHHE